MNAIVLGLVVLAAPASGGVEELSPEKPIATAAGKVTRELMVGEDKPARLVLGGEKVLYSRDGDLEPTYLVSAVNAAGDDVIFCAVHSDDPTQKSCTKYVFVTVHKDGSAQASDELGDCTEQFKIERNAGAISVRFAEGAWKLEDGKLSQLTTKKKAKKK